jgi:hypothetical protein
MAVHPLLLWHEWSIIGRPTTMRRMRCGVGKNMFDIREFMSLVRKIMSDVRKIMCLVVIREMVSV